MGGGSVLGLGLSGDLGGGGLDLERFWRGPTTNSNALDRLGGIFTWATEAGAVPYHNEAGTRQCLVTKSKNIHVKILLY